MSFPRSFIVLFVWLCGQHGLLAAPTEPLRPSDVVVVYNSSLEQSHDLALFYASSRHIPIENLVGLELPDQLDLTREQYDELLANPLRNVFLDRNWWRVEQVGDFLEIKGTVRRRVIALMRGVPRRIAQQGENGGALQENCASIDSELAGLGLFGAPIDGALQNPYFEKEESFLATDLQPFFLVGRIDGPSWEDAQRMIEDAIATERTGLWGHAYLDQDDLHPLGAEWIAAAAQDCMQWGMPMIVEPTGYTLPPAYPMEHAALYYGWYDHQWSGALRNPQFRFRRGAVAVHIHSFSAVSLEASRNWCGPILAHGAAATLGNVFEPYLQLTHQLDTFNQRLFAGYSLAESAFMSVPVTSWMWTVLGDPLYRPFAVNNQLEVDQEIANEDPNWLWKRLRQLRLMHGEEGYFAVLQEYAEESQQAIAFEAMAMLALDQEEKGKELYREALAQATQLAVLAEDALRYQLLLVQLDLLENKQEEALERLALLRELYQESPCLPAIVAMMERIAPPDPPQVQ